MDYETRAAIDALTSGSKKRTRTKASHKEYDWRTGFPFHSTIDKPRPSYCYNPAERDLVSLKNEIATLSVDTASASIVLKAPINDDLIARIENAVPITQREWLGSERAWRFSPAALPMLKPILKDTYKDVQMLGVPKALPATKFDQLMSKLNKDDKATIYKLLAAKYHPDKGGSHEVMTLINIVFRG